MIKSDALVYLAYIQQYLEDLPDDDVVQANENAFENMRKRFVVLFPHMSMDQLNLFFGNDLIEFVWRANRISGIAAVRNLGFSLEQATLITTNILGRRK